MAEEVKAEGTDTAKPGVLPIDKMAAQMYPEKTETKKVEAEAKVEESDAVSKEVVVDEAEVAKAASDAAKVDEKKEESAKDDSTKSDTADQGLSLKHSDGSPLDKAQFDELVTFAKEQKLSQEQAQKLLERESAIVSQFKKAEADRLEAEKPYGEAWQKREAEWRAAAMKDTEIGGTPEKFAENAELAKRAISSFGDKQMMDFLNASGLGSHPMAIRMFSRIGRLTQEGKLKTGGQPGNGKPRSPEERMYPNMFKSQEQ